MEAQTPSEDPIGRFWSRTHWLLSAFVSIPPFLLALLSLSYVEQLETERALSIFSFTATVISCATVIWKWLELRQRTGVCPNIKHSTVCRPYFNKCRQLKFEVLPGFYLSCLAGALTTLCVGLALFAINEAGTDFRMIGCWLSLSPVLLYLLWELRKKDEFRFSVAGYIFLLSAAHFLLNWPTEWHIFDVSLPLLLLSFLISLRNLALKQSSKDFASNTSTICSMFTAGLLGLVLSLFYPPQAWFEVDACSLLYSLFAVCLYVGFIAMNYSIVHGSAAAATATAVFAVSMATVCFAMDVPLWCRTLGLLAFLLGSFGLLWELSSPSVTPMDDEKQTQPANEIEDADAYYMPLLEGPGGGVVR